MTGLWLISYVALWVLTLGMAVVLISVLHNLGVLHQMISGTANIQPPPSKLKVDQHLPMLTLHTLDGTAVSLEQFRGIKTAFSVVSPGCSGCVRLLEDMVSADGDVSLDPLDSTMQQQVIISVADIPATAALVHQVQLPQELVVLADPKNQVGKAWGVRATPVTVIVDPELTVVRQVVGATAPQPATSTVGV